MTCAGLWSGELRSRVRSAGLIAGSIAGSIAGLIAGSIGGPTAGLIAGPTAACRVPMRCHLRQCAWISGWWCALRRHALLRRAQLSACADFAAGSVADSLAESAAILAAGLVAGSTAAQVAGRLAVGLAAGAVAGARPAALRMSFAARCSRAASFRFRHYTHAIWRK